MRGAKELKRDSTGRHAGDAATATAGVAVEARGAGTITRERRFARTISSLSSPPAIVNDVHSQLNETRVGRIVEPDSLEALQTLIRRARETGGAVSVAGGRHAMGGQQFATNGVLVDMRCMNRVLSFDPARYEIEVEAGIQWPQLINFMVAAQSGRATHRQASIVQKQTGADNLSIGGALAANIHGRGLNLKPFVGDVESFVLVDAEGEARRCSRSENRELFSLVVGGYGLFGIVASVRLRLARRRKLERVARITTTRNLAGAFDERIEANFLYGDFQFVTDETSPDFLRRGIFSCYRPVADGDAPVPEDQVELCAEDWQNLYHLAHVDRRRAFEVYSGHYLATSGQLYWSDTHQLSVYLDDYHRQLDVRLGARVRSTEMITEVYVPRDALAGFLEIVRRDFRRHAVELIYGTVRLIERDNESFLAWAKDSYACIVFNLHTEHSAAGIRKAQTDFQRLITRAIEAGGSYYLTYHRWATREQVETCYPQLREFLRRKRCHDPREIFQSDWYRHYREMFDA
ncbi:MAG TPA: FAD-binding oxidoreductase [Pyrinomonadaceae bacterium]|jgi:FAD/FMN-containing dehydrogenase|nr:FAD-binding oxidoreductase [Pyrinomonadaceae bacterium]